MAEESAWSKESEAWINPARITPTNPPSRQLDEFVAQPLFIVDVPDVQNDASWNMLSVSIMEASPTHYTMERQRKISWKCASM